MSYEKLMYGLKSEKKAAEIRAFNKKKDVRAKEKRKAIKDKIEDLMLCKEFGLSIKDIN